MFKLELEKGQKLFFTSDTHYHHKNVVRGVSEWSSEDLEMKGTSRDFDTLEEMNSQMIKNINKTVGENDILIHLGDFSFAGIDKIPKFRQAIKCKNIYLIRGNHDHHMLKNKELEGEMRGTQDLFKHVSDYMDLDLRLPAPKGERKPRFRFVLMHFPLASFKDQQLGVMHLHGHMHFQGDDRFGPGRMMDVGIDGHPEFRPYSLDEVIGLIKSRPIKSYLADDHHY